ncbi:MAG TPA: formate dehydrogenase accessory protein FdhE [Thermoanaerobaculia bacterium]|nr:formate dehydrogenase accessory protein FdhE [Thermoanaerobaculia bacterium]
MSRTATQQSAAEIFEQRGARAALLASRNETSRDPLEFAADLSRVQAACCERLRQAALTGRLADDLDLLLPLLDPMLRVIATRSEQAEEHLDDDPQTRRTRLHVYWAGDANDYDFRALLQPYASVLRSRTITPDRVHKRGHCPFCGGAAWIGARRQQPEAESGFRFLQCSLCALEWNISRIHCPSCFEEDPYKLPQFQSDAHPNVRIEACETCRRYVKSIDLTQDARPIPAVDDLLSLSMDLWAAEEGFSRIEPGIAGI